MPILLVSPVTRPGAYWVVPPSLALGIGFVAPEDPLEVACPDAPLVATAKTVAKENVRRTFMTNTSVAIPS